MYRMSEDKSPDIRKRLSQELTHSLFRADEDVNMYDVDEVRFQKFLHFFHLSTIGYPLLSFYSFLGGLPLH